MPRKQPEPFWRNARNCWFVQVGGKQHRLSPDEAEARRMYHGLMARPPESRTAVASPTPRLVVEALDEFLAWAAPSAGSTIGDRSGSGTSQRPADAEKIGAESIGTVRVHPAGSALMA